MPIEETWARIEDEIAARDLGKARDRLHGLLVTYPEDLAIRHRLGEVYWMLGHPAMAGRYWYLEAPAEPARSTPPAPLSAPAAGACLRCCSRSSSEATRQS